MSAGHQSDFRNSIRFPLHLQVTLKTPTAEYHAKTTDISAGGILFHTETDIEVGSPVEFTIEMPVEVSRNQPSRAGDMHRPGGALFRRRFWAKRCGGDR